MTDDSNDELRKRFESTQQDEQPSDVPDSDDEPSNVKEDWAHLAMYVPPELATEYHEFADNLDARSKLLGNGGVDKNREFNRTVVEFVLENREEIAEQMDLSKDKIDF